MTSLTPNYSKLELFDLFTFSHGGNGNKQGGLVTLVWLESLSSAISVL